MKLISARFCIVLFAFIFSRTGFCQSHIALVGSSYGSNERKAIVSDIHSVLENKKIIIDDCGEKLPTSDLNRYRLIFISSEIKPSLNSNELQSLKTYVENGGHLFLLHLAPHFIIENRHLWNSEMQWTGIRKLVYDKKGADGTIIHPTHLLLKDTGLDKNPSVSWLREATVTIIPSENMENIIGADQRGCLLGKANYGKGWTAYLGLQYFRFQKNEDSAGLLKIISNIFSEACM